MKRYFLKGILILLVLLPGMPAMAQSLTQTIRGRVVDETSLTPIPGVTVVIVGSEPLKGAVTDIDGYFKIESVPVGRVDLGVSFVGYKPRLISNVVVNSGKEVVLDITIVENVEQIETVEITGSGEKEKTLNEMSLISARAFTIEETERYAGTFNDAARMAANFAGVTGDPAGNNDIIVRGNSPKGILWRLDGIEITNPNHFAVEGGTGGGINALNSTMLTNSDFLTGAFAPEYGNAISGVFDIKMRQGNYEKSEYSLGVGVLGVDFAAEGPFKKGSKASYLVNYRYSSLGLLDDLSLVDFGGVPKYQDLSFKVYVPTKSAGIFSVFGIAGLNSIDEGIYNKAKDTVLSSTTYNGELSSFGINHSYFLDQNAYIKTSLSYSGNASGFDDYTLWDGNETLTYTGEADFSRYNTRLFSTYNRKFNAKNSLVAGGGLTLMNYSFYWNEKEKAGSDDTRINDSNRSSYLQAFGSWLHRPADDITIVGGIHLLYFNLNQTYSVEPRISASWDLTDRNTLSAGAGVHSRIESLISYTVNVPDESGTLTQPNTGLSIPKAAHAVAGYGYKISQNTHLKIETYYQWLYDNGVENDPASTFSLLNVYDGFDQRELVSEGEGYNYGAELTLERFFADNFYYLLTASVYESKYRALDNVWRKGRFSNDFNTNFLAGKEFRVGDPAKNKSLSVDIKFTVIGANRYTPVDAEASVLADEEVLREDVPYSKRGDTIFIANISGRYKKNNPKTTHIFKFEINNATNNKAVIGEYYDEALNEVVKDYQLELIPNIMYVLQF